jgi:hypothetical protein
MKTYKGAWSIDTFLIDKVMMITIIAFVHNRSKLQVKHGVPDRYSLKNMENVPLIGTYYNEELMEVKLPD